MLIEKKWFLAGLLTLTAACSVETTDPNSESSGGPSNGSSSEPNDEPAEPSKAFVGKWTGSVETVADASFEDVGEVSLVTLEIEERFGGGVSFLVTVDGEELEYTGTFDGSVLRVKGTAFDEDGEGITITDSSIRVTGDQMRGEMRVREEEDGNELELDLRADRQSSTPETGDTPELTGLWRFDFTIESISGDCAEGLDDSDIVGQTTTIEVEMFGDLEDDLSGSIDQGSPEDAGFEDFEVTQDGNTVTVTGTAFQSGTKVEIFVSMTVTETSISGSETVTTTDANGSTCRFTISIEGRKLSGLASKAMFVGDWQDGGQPLEATLHGDSLDLALSYQAPGADQPVRLEALGLALDEQRAFRTEFPGLPGDLQLVVSGQVLFTQDLIGEVTVLDAQGLATSATPFHVTAR